MRTILFMLFSASSQNRNYYLQNNSFDLCNNEFLFPQKDFSIIGFGAYHGSSKTYEAELQLIKSLVKNNDIDYYFLEANYSQAYFINKYLSTGDEQHLKKLALLFETIVTQEGTIDAYLHWKNMKKINDSLSSDRKIIVAGVDIINEYYFPIKHLVELTNHSHADWAQLSNLAD